VLAYRNGAGVGSYVAGSNFKIPDEAFTTYNYIQTHGGAPPPNFKGGGIFQNRPEAILDSTPNFKVSPLPTGANYKKYDIYENVPGVNRGSERVIVGDTGDAFYTYDHYKPGTNIPLIPELKLTSTALRGTGIVLMAYGAYKDILEIAASDNKVKKTTEKVSAWTVASAGASAGAELGAAIGIAGGPIGIIVGGVAGGLIGGTAGYVVGSELGKAVYDAGTSIYNSITHLR